MCRRPSFSAAAPASPHSMKLRRRRRRSRRRRRRQLRLRGRRNREASAISPCGIRSLPFRVQWDTSRVCDCVCMRKPARVCERARVLRLCFSLSLACARTCWLHMPQAELGACVRARGVRASTCPRPRSVSSVTQLSAEATAVAPAEKSPDASLRAGEANGTCEAGITRTGGRERAADRRGWRQVPAGAQGQTGWRVACAVRHGPRVRAFCAPATRAEPQTGLFRERTEGIWPRDSPDTSLSGPTRS